ncbi:unnamed protein product [Adineta ricciae]|uniref:Protein phosphatase 1 regulatory subunit 42 n=1 Tax=Adineta ricciae TaxID=249248 RepID=A0A813QTL3_ADIRI|nr:unnamed protein product [Adineta ricciae]CAF0771007.1 unnamed protein product [Adineta ricciae]
MVKLTAELIAKQTPGHNKRRADESVEHYLARLTHLPFQDRNIDSIESIPPCRLLTVIYLYDNALTKIENLNFAENLTHLYLQNNRLQKLENLDCCAKLQKLYLGGNQIQVLEGLDKNLQIKEIYIENQRLPEGEKLVFEPRTLHCLSQGLEILNVSGNNLDSLTELSCLDKLQELSASNNRLENLRELVELLSIWPRLKRLDTNRNPLCSKGRYRERLIVASTTLEMLDGKQITDNSRQFLTSWKASREAVQTRERSRPDFDNPSAAYSSHRVSVTLPSIGTTVTRAQSMTIHQMPEPRRQGFMSESSSAKKSQFQISFGQNGHRKLTAGSNRTPSFHSSQNSNHPELTISSHGRMFTAHGSTAQPALK